MAHTISNKPGICGGKSCIDGTRIRVIDIIERYKILGEKVEEIAANYGIPVEAVLAALSYYYQNPEKIQEELKREKELIQKIRSEMKGMVYAT